MNTSVIRDGLVNVAELVKTKFLSPDALLNSDLVELVNHVVAMKLVGSACFSDHCEDYDLMLLVDFDQFYYAPGSDLMVAEFDAKATHHVAYLATSSFQDAWRQPRAAGRYFPNVSCWSGKKLNIMFLANKAAFSAIVNSYESAFFFLHTEAITMNETLDTLFESYRSFYGKANTYRILGIAVGTSPRTTSLLASCADDPMRIPKMYDADERLIAEENDFDLPVTHIWDDVSSKD